MIQYKDDADGFYMDTLDYQAFIEGKARRLAALASELEDLTASDDYKVATKKRVRYNNIVARLEGVVEDVEKETQRFRQWFANSNATNEKEKNK